MVSHISVAEHAEFRSKQERTIYIPQVSAPAPNAFQKWEKDKRKLLGLRCILLQEGIAGTWMSNSEILFFFLICTIHHVHAGKKSGMPPGTVAPPFPNLKLLRFCSLIPLLLSFFHPKSYYATDLTNSRHFVDCPVAVLPIFNSSCKHIHVLRCFRVSWRVSHVHILSTLFTATAVKSSLP